MEQAGSSTSTGQQPLSPDELHLLQLMICAMRTAARAASGARGLEAAARRFIAWQTQREDALVHALWCGLRASSLRKLRGHLTRGDYAAGGERLSALEWAVVDLLLLYDTPLLSVASFHYRAQLQALERTFQLVQRFQLEPEDGRPVSPARWSRAAHRYCRGVVQLSAVALQRRWHELKLDARRRACAPPAPGNPRPLVLPIHQAVINRYPHVAESRELLTWPALVAAGRVAEPTDERGPAPGESRPNSPPRSDGPTKSVETIDLSDDEESQGDTLFEAKNCSTNYTPVITVSDDELSPDNIKKDKSLCRKEKNSQSKTDRRNVVLEKCMNVIVKPEIIEIDENAPSPTDNVVEAIRDVDINNVDATVIYEEDDVKNIIDIQMGNVDRDATTASVASDDDENIKVKTEIIDDLFLSETVIQQYNAKRFTQIKDSCQNLETIRNVNNTALDNYEAQINVKEETTNETNNKPVCEVDSENVNVIVKPEIIEIDENAPSPTDNVVEAIQDVDMNNVDATVTYEEDDVKNIIDIQMGNVDRDATTASVASDDDENIKVKTEIIDDLFLSETVIQQYNAKQFTQIKDSCQNLETIRNVNNTALDNYEAQINVKEETTNETNNKPVCEVDSENVNNLILGHKLDDFNLLDQLKHEILTKLENNLDDNLINRTGKDNINIDDPEILNIKTESSDEEGECYEQDNEHSTEIATNDTIKTEQTNTIESNNTDEIDEALDTIKTETNFNNEDHIDPRLLMLPVVLLRRIDDPMRPLEHRSSQRPISSKSYSQIFYEKNKDMLRKCKPCAVPVRRVDEEWGAGVRGDTRKRVRLPDMDAVRRNYCGLLTAEVAPVAPRLIDPNGNKRVRLNMPYNHRPVRPSVVPFPRSSEPPPLIPVRSLVPSPWTRNLGTPAVPVSTSTDQNPSMIDPAWQTNYQIVRPDQFNLLHLQNNQDSPQREQPLQNINLPLLNSLTNPMMQAQDIPNWSNSLQQQNATQNVYARTRPPWSQTQAATVSLAPNISTQNISPPNIPLLNWPPDVMTGMQPTNIQSVPCLTIDGTLNARGLTDLQRNYSGTQTGVLPAGQIINSQLSPFLANQIPNPMSITAQRPQAMLVNNPLANLSFLCSSFQPPQLQAIRPSQMQTVKQTQTVQPAQVQTLEPPRMQILPSPQTQTVQTPQMLTSRSPRMHQPPQIRRLQPPRFQPLCSRMRTLQQPPHMLKLQPPQTQTSQLPQMPPLQPAQMPTLQPAQMPMLQPAQMPTLQPAQTQTSQLPQMPPLQSTQMSTLQPDQVPTSQPAQMQAIQLPQMPPLQPAPIEASTSNRDTAPVVDEPATNVEATSGGQTDMKRDKMVDTLATPIKNLFTDIESNYDYHYVYKSSELLDWSQPPLTYAEVFPQRPDVKRVLCTGARPWRLRGRLLVSEHQPPPASAAVWTLRPRVRLLRPDDGKAPLNVGYQDRIYQKICDQPLTYAMMLTAVDNVADCRRLLSRGCKLLLYCLRTCTLLPIDAQRLNDGSFVLSGGPNTEVSLAELTLQLKRLRPLAPKPSGPQPSASGPLVPEQPASGPSGPFPSGPLGPQPPASGPSVPESASEPYVSETGVEPSVLELLTSETLEPISSTSETFAPEALEPKPSPSGTLDSEAFVEPLDAEPFTPEPLDPKLFPLEPLVAEPFALEPLEPKLSPSESLHAELFALEPLEPKLSPSEPLDADASKPDTFEPQPSTFEPMSPKSSSSEPSEAKPSTLEQFRQPLLSGPLEAKSSSPEPEPCPPKSNEPIPSAGSLPMFSTSSAKIAPMLTALISAQRRPPTSLQTENQSASMLPSSASNIPSESIPTATLAPVASTSTSRAVMLGTLLSAPSRPIKAVLPERVKADEYTHVDFSVLSEEDFVAKYRLPKACVRALGEDLKPYIRNYNINKVLSCLRYLSSDAEQRPAVDSVLRVLCALNHNAVLDKYIRPHDYLSVTERTRRGAAVRRFEELYHLPNVVGVIDGVQVPLGELPAAPGAFLNRAGFHSLNVQLVCDADLTIFSVDCSQGGSVQDGDIWATSGLRHQLQHLRALGETVWLLGDVGYLQRETLMTPFPSPADPPSRRYNALHAQAWSSVRRCVHRLRSRWRRLTAPLPEKRASRIINACVILHNIAEKWNAPVPKDIEFELKQKRINDLLEEQQESAVVSLVTAPDRHRLLREWQRGTEARERLVTELARSFSDRLEDR